MLAYFLALTLLFSPAYAIRFNLFGFPTNLLMVWVFLVWLIFLAWLLAKKQTCHFFVATKKCNIIFLFFIFLFSISGIISLFAHGFDRQKLGQFIILFLQPISIFFIGRYLNEQYPKTKNLLLTSCYLLLAAAGLFAIYQYFTLHGLNPAYWGNSVEPKRATSFFSHPNFYALWSAPLLAFLIPNVFALVKGQMSKVKCLKVAAWLLGAAGLLLSLSRAGWLGLAAAIAVYTLVAADKKIKKLILSAVIVIFIVIVITPNLRYRVLLPFYREKSAVSRLSLWQTGWKGIKESTITGLGLTGFSRQWSTLNTDPNLDTHNYPHNIFLDLWVETGIIGLVGLIGLIGYLIYTGLLVQHSPPFQGGVPRAESRGEVVGAVKDHGLKIKDIRLPVALFLIALLFSGLVDNPYFKNDLAMVFWIILSLV